MLDYTKSPCIEAGDPSSPADPDGTVADMGAYYFDQTGFNTITMDIKAFLQGPFVNNLMVPNLNMLGLIPLHHPYCITPWNHFGTESVSSIPNNNVIDWVFIEIRKLNNLDDLSDYYPVCRRAAFIMNNGTVRNSNNSLIGFLTKENDSLYICLFHRATCQ